MSFLSAVLANLMPAIAGAMILVASLGRPVNLHVIGFSLGAGYVLGVGLVALSMWLGSVAGLADASLATALVLFAVTLAGGIAVLRQGTSQAPRAHREAPSWQWAVWSVLLGILLINGILLSGEGLTRPIYPWDAWSAWAVKPRVWFELGADIDFVSFRQWLGSKDVHDYTNEAWQYPELLPRFQLWVIRWVGHWDEQLAMLPWSFLHVACLLSIYHVLRILGLTGLAAMVTCFLVGSIPILDVQIALPGLIDIWIAAELLLFSACLLLAIETDRWRWIVLSLLFLGLAAATKLEGVVWLIICLPVLLCVAQSPRVRGYGLLAVLAGVAVWWAVGGISLALGPDLQFTLTPKVIDLPYIGRYSLAFTNNLGPFRESFLNLSNWHLTGYLLLPVMLWAVMQQRRQRTAQGLAVFAIVGLGFMFLLFFLTRAAVWAESMTASNRLALQFVPACMLWTGLLVARRLQESR